MVLPNIFSEPIAIWLLQEGQRRTGIHLVSSEASEPTDTNSRVSGAGSGDTSGAVAFQGPIGFAGAMFVVGTLMLCSAKRWKQGSWKPFVKT